MEKLERIQGSSVMTGALLILVIIGNLVSGVRAEEAAARREDRLKAGYVMNFVRFVEWPASVSPDVLTVCFIGAEGVDMALASGIEGKRAGARYLAVRQLSEFTATAGCNVLYLDSAIAARRPRQLMESELPILTVSDAEAFVQRGGMIELFIEGNRLRFRVNVGNAQKAGLRISSSLLQLAATVDRVSTP